MTRLAETFRIQKGCVFAHPNADRLDLIDVYGDGRTIAIVKRGDFVEGEIAVFINSLGDPMVPVADERFAFLLGNAKADGFARVRVARLRGIESRGLVIKAAPDMTDEDMDVSESLGLVKWTPWRYGSRRAREGGANGYSVGPTHVEWGPSNLLPMAKYDIEGLGKMHRLLIPGEDVVITEKVHGSNGCVFHDTVRLWVRSRSLFRRRAVDDEQEDVWWKVVAHANLEQKLSQSPHLQNLALYGEVYGEVQDLHYGLKGIGARFVLFDVWHIGDRRWLPWSEVKAIAAELDLPTVPVLYEGPWHVEEINERTRPHADVYALAEGPSILAALNGMVKPHTREGIVITPQPERYDMRYGRVKFKWVGTGYSTRKEESSDVAFEEEV